MPTVTIPLVGSFVNRGDITKDQQFFNCFPQIDENATSGGKTLSLYKRGGINSGSVSTANNLSSLGFCTWVGKADGTGPALLSFTNSAQTATRIYYIGEGVSITQLGGDIANASGCSELTEATISGTSNIVAVIQDSATSVNEGWYIPEGGAWTQITDTDFPPNQTPAIPIIGCPAYLDGYTFWMCTNGQIWNSDINSVSSYSANNFITAQQSPDPGVGLARYKDFIVAFGKKSVEFFTNQGNPAGSPLSVVKGATIAIGALSIGVISSIRTIGDTVYWVGQEASSGKYGVWRLNGTQAEKISNATVDKFITTNSSYIAGICGAFPLDGKTHIAFSNQSGTTTFNFCYCVDTGQWWTLQLYGQVNSIRSIASAGASLFLNGYSSQDRVYSNYQVSAQTDNNSAYSAIIRTAGIDLGTDKKKFISNIWLDADTQSTGTATLEASDDDYASWYTLGTFDMTKTNKYISRCGSHRSERAYRLTHSANTAFHARALRIEYKVGQS